MCFSQLRRLFVIFCDGRSGAPAKGSLGRLAMWRRGDAVVNWFSEMVLREKSASFPLYFVYFKICIVIFQCDSGVVRLRRYSNVQLPCQRSDAFIYVGRVGDCFMREVRVSLLAVLICYLWCRWQISRFIAGLSGQTRPPCFTLFVHSVNVSLLDFTNSERRRF